MKLNVSSVAGWYTVPFTMFPFSKLARNIDPNSSSNVQVLLPLSITPLIVATWAVSSLTLPGKKLKVIEKRLYKKKTIVFENSLNLTNVISVTSLFLERKLLFSGISFLKLMICAHNFETILFANSTTKTPNHSEGEWFKQWLTGNNVGK